MKTGIHPDYNETKVSCNCGTSWITRSTLPAIKVEICSSCHPFYTGRAKFVDTAGRIERFQRKYGWGDKTKGQTATETATETASETETKTETATETAEK